MHLRPACSLEVLRAFDGFADVGVSKKPGAQNIRPAVRPQHPPLACLSFGNLWNRPRRKSRSLHEFLGHAESLHGTALPCTVNHAIPRQPARVLGLWTAAVTGQWLSGKVSFLGLTG